MTYFFTFDLVKDAEVAHQAHEWLLDHIGEYGSWSHNFSYGYPKVKFGVPDEYAVQFKLVFGDYFV